MATQAQILASLTNAIAGIQQYETGAGITLNPYILQGFQATYDFVSDNSTDITNLVVSGTSDLQGAVTIGGGLAVTGAITGTSAATTGVANTLTATALTTGTALKIVAAAATLTTGRYVSYNDGALEVFGIGANGHIHTSQTTAPSIIVTTPNGITAAAITAGGTDVCGVITTTGTNNNGGNTVIDVTFHKTYTTAPKSVQLQALNTAASKAAAVSLLTAYVSARTATGFTITIPADANAIATPSWSYQVIA